MFKARGLNPDLLCGILHLGLQGHRDEGGYIDPVPHLELFMSLQCAHKDQQECLVAHQLREQLQSFLHIISPSVIHLIKDKAGLTIEHM